MLTIDRIKGANKQFLSNKVWAAIAAQKQLSAVALGRVGAQRIDKAVGWPGAGHREIDPHMGRRDREFAGQLSQLAMAFTRHQERHAEMVTRVTSC